YIERFTINWHARKTHTELIRRGESVVHPQFDYISCTLDAYRAADGGTVIDCKAIGAYRKIDEVIGYYTPQSIVQRACVGCRNAALLIVHGGAEPVEYPVPIDAGYEKEVFVRIAEFWQCVETLTPPFEMETKLAPVAAIKEYDFSGNNEWCSLAGGWLENKAS